jgi:hypothetical protein
MAWNGNTSKWSKEDIAKYESLGKTPIASPELQFWTSGDIQVFVKAWLAALASGFMNVNEAWHYDNDYKAPAFNKISHKQP